MTGVLRLALADLRFRALAAGFNVLLLALGIAIVAVLLRLGGQVERSLQRDLAGIDLVVGAKGSPLQLVLSAALHVDVPTGNILLSDAEALAANPLVRQAIPVALGDNARGFRIVGTSAAYPAHYGAALAAGRLWFAPMEAVLGSDAAAGLGLRVGDGFVGSHGLVADEAHHDEEEHGDGDHAEHVEDDEHGHHPYTVVGVLAPTGTVLDRLILTDVASVWEVHAVHDEGTQAPPREITAMLVTYRTPLAAASMPRLVNATTAMQAASPAFEVARLVKLAGFGTDAVRSVAYGLMGLAALGFFATLFGAIHDRRYDIVLLRSLGATRARVFAVVLAEGAALATAGIVAGFALSHALMAGAAAWIGASHRIAVGSALLEPAELWIAAGALALGLASALVPAMMAYRVDVARTLARGPA